MEQISQQLPEAQAVTSPTTRSSFWFILVAFIIFILLIVAGAGYYYLEVYTPAQYAKGVIPLYHEIRSQEIGTSNLKGSSDYEGLLTILDQYQAFLTQTKVKLSQLKPAPIATTPSFLTNTERSKQVQEDFTKILELFMSNIAKAKKQAQFMIKAKELFLLLRPDLTDYPPKAVPAGQPAPSSPTTSTVGEFLAVWESRILQAKVVAQEFFSEPIDLGDVSFEELRQLWQETEQGLDVMLPFLRKQDPKLPFVEVQKLAPESQRGTLAKVDKIDELLPLLENLLIRNSGENILKNQFSGNAISSSEFTTLSRRLDTAMKDIKAKYGK